MEDFRLLNLKEVAAILGIGYTTARRWRVQGKLPRPRLIVAQRCYWSQMDIIRWEAARPLAPIVAHDERNTENR